mmetsp:Transcript_37536/g.86670  ORF Transcript_37536/g.86670 Transcript_37536/m.86670 type:complete len:93 (-) Transcript_37536:971-1249(-)
MAAIQPAVLRRHQQHQHSAQHQHQHQSPPRHDHPQTPRPLTHSHSLRRHQLNIAYPATGNQKDIDIDDERKLRALYDMRISQEVDGSALGEE